ncbi:MAG: serine hydrolase domain-containing protein [Chloroflexota bacterium]
MLDRSTPHHDEHVDIAASDRLPAEVSGYSLAAIQRFHADFDPATWPDAGTELTHYCYVRMTEFFPHALIPSSGVVAPLPYEPIPEIADTPARTPNGTLTLRAFQELAPVDGFIVAHRGRVVYESYPGMRSADNHLWWSVSKTLAGALIAGLEERGMVDPKQAIDAYLPELRSSGWEGVSVQDILDMASGINCLESDDPIAYTSPSAPFYRYESTLGMLPATDQTPASTYDYIASLSRLQAPGEVFQYTSANTFVLGWLAERLTGKPYAELVHQEIWRHSGAEADAAVLISATGAAASHGGISSRLRDLVRYGLLYTPSWHAVTETPVISAAYLRKIQTGGRPEVFARGAGSNTWLTMLGERPRHNTYMWDVVMDDGDFFKAGFNGQGLWISPTRDLVIAFFGHGNAAAASVSFARAIAISRLFAESAA